MVGVNRVGDVEGLAHGGASAIIDTLGVPLVEGDDQEAVLVADIDPATVRGVRARFPFLADRR